MTKVILIKGHKGERIWRHQSATLACRRAEALADLHGDCEVTTSDQGFTVHAAKFYDAALTRQRRIFDGLKT